MNDDGIASRLRNRNGRATSGNQDKDFVYEKDIEKIISSESGRIPAGSWSGKESAIAVVEFKKKYRKGKKGNKNQEEASDSSELSKSCSNIYQDQQQKLSQQRLDLWISGPNRECNESIKKYNVDVKVNVNVDQISDKELLAPRCETTQQYGSDYESPEQTRALLTTKESENIRSVILEQTEGDYQGLKCQNNGKEQILQVVKENLSQKINSVNADNTIIHQDSMDINVGEEPQMEQCIMASQKEKIGMWEDLLKAIKDEVKKSAQEAVHTEVKKAVPEAIEESMKDVKESWTKNLEVITEKQTELENQVSVLTSTNKKLTDDLGTIQVQLKECTSRLNEVLGIVVRQDQILHEYQDKFEEMHGKLERDTLRINGLEVQEEENCVEKVKNFFAEKLKIEEDINIKEAYRSGQGKPKAMVVVLQNYRDKRTIFSHTKNLKGVKNANDKYYDVFDQLTAKKLAERKGGHQIAAINNSMEGVDKLTVKRERGKLMINGKEYRKEIKVPSSRDILLASKERRQEREKLHITAGNVIQYEGQQFAGYTIPAKNLQEVNEAYAKVKSLHMDARHIICACRLPGCNFHTHQDFTDNDEHNLGAFVLRLLVDLEIMNRAVFVARVYDGSHIGNKRYDAIRDAVTSAVSKSGQNKITSVFDHIWDKQLDNKFEKRFGGGKSIRGGFGCGRSGVGYQGVLKVTGPKEKSPGGRGYTEAVAASPTKETAD